MYGSTSDKKKIKDAIAILDYAYSKIPSTKGCLEHINLPESKGGCGGWCCKYQFPSVLYVEFLNTWKYVTSNWDDEKIGNLIKASLKNYLFDSPVKGCVFFDHDSRMCSQHSTRPLACRVYGIIPEEEFKPRYERLRVINPNVRDQCNLVETENGKTVTTKDTDYWWKEVKQAEKSLGIKDSYITDEYHGSYRAYHDHILIHLFGEEHMSKLSIVRTHLSDTEKNTIIEQMMSVYYSIKESLGESIKSEDT